MRTRSAAARPQPATSPTTTSSNSAPAAEQQPSIEELDRKSDERRAALAQATTQPLQGAPIPDKLLPGDRVSFTAGKELFAPVKYHTFEVGPVTVETTVAPGETAADAFARAAVAAKTMFEAEFHLKRVEYFQRLAQIEVPR